jgi:hypothetical protein
MAKRVTKANVAKIATMAPPPIPLPETEPLPEALPYQEAGEVSNDDKPRPPYGLIGLVVFGVFVVALIMFMGFNTANEIKSLGQ